MKDEELNDIMELVEQYCDSRIKKGHHLYNTESLAEFNKIKTVVEGLLADAAIERKESC